MTSDIIRAAIEQLRASLDALGDMGLGRWDTNHEFVVMHDDGEEWEVADCDTQATGRRDSLAAHIALTASPHVTEALAALLEAELAERSEDARLATIPPGLDLAEIERDYATPAAEAEIRRRRALVALAEAITHRRDHGR